ncbi:MAG: hypothetical protein FJ137_14255 [Deltaproteobacteria bacterium]|nr:hypothetical protein [Deltaproteobacteria bacterium]
MTDARTAGPCCRRPPWPAVVGVALALAAPGCLFLPAIEDDGYTACTRDSECAPGRSCAANVGLCAPPPWHDEEFIERRLLAVENRADVELPAGTAVPVRFGGPDGVIPLEEIRPDARFVDFDPGAAEWRVVGVYRDLFRDRFDVWIPLSRPLAAGARDALAWLEHRTREGGVRVLEDPTSAFALFDDCDAFPVEGDDTRFVDAPGAAALVPGDGKVEVVDNTTVIWRVQTGSPSSVTFRARINGVTCDQVFLGFTSSGTSPFVSPSAGFFLGDDLQTTADVIASPTQPAQPADPPRRFAEAPGAEHRFTIVVDGSRVRLVVDDVVFAELKDIDPPFGAAPLFPTVQVGGACSVSVDAVWVTPLPFVRPVVQAEPAVVLDLNY